MIDILATILGATQVGSLIAIIWLVYKSFSAKDDAVVAAKALTDTQRVSDQYAEQRDQYVVQLAQARAMVATLQDRLTETAKERDAAFLKGREDVVAKLQTAPISDAAKFLSDLLQSPIPTQTATATSGDSTAAHAVQSATTATSTHPPDRLPGA